MILLAVVFLWKPEGHLSSLPARLLLWVAAMVLVNAWNYIDHADGLFALNAFAAASILYLASPRLGPAAEAVPLLASVAGACVGFFLWNRPPARIFLGDAGSLVLGFILVAVAVWRVDGEGATALPGSLGAHGVVIADFLLVTVARLKRGANPFKGGCEHSGHRLSARLGGGVALVVFALVNALLALIVGTAGPAHPARRDGGSRTLHPLVRMDRLAARAPAPGAGGALKRARSRARHAPHPWVARGRGNMRTAVSEATVRKDRGRAFEAAGVPAATV